MLTKEELPACPVATTVQLIGSKWKLLILRNLMQRPWRFNGLTAAAGNVSGDKNGRTHQYEHFSGNFTGKFCVVFFLNLC